MVCTGEEMHEAASAPGWPGGPGMLPLTLKLDRVEDFYRIK